MSFLQRRQRAVNLLSEKNLHALLLVQRENLRYFCGFTGSDGALLLTQEGAIFLTDSRYTTQAKAEVAADSIQENNSKIDGLVTALKAAKVARIGFESTLPYGTVDELRTRGEADWSWQALKDDLAVLRLVKNPDEIKAIEQAAGLNLKAFQLITEMIVPGASERELAINLEHALKQQGAEEKAFDFIVASGERGAMPHGVASQRSLQMNELVTIDFGCRVSGYHSDETVTLSIGMVSSALRRIFDTVLAAHDLAMAAVAPGVPLREIDRIARDSIAQAGYGEYFGHGLGHGVGLEVHEAPVLSPRATVVAEKGMVFTIEPGIYVPGLGGVRIEDMVLVTEDGSRTLTLIPKTFKNILVK